MCEIILAWIYTTDSAIFHQFFSTQSRTLRQNALYVLILDVN